MKFLGSLLLIIILGVGVALSFLGFVPFVSDVIGANKPRDLGITYTQADYLSVGEKNNVDLIVIETPSSSPEESLSFSGSTAVDAFFSSEEMTARVNISGENWKYYPITDFQVKFNEDGTTEMSGMLHFERLKGYALATKVDPSDINAVSKVFDALRIPRKPIPVYLKGEATVTNNRVTISASKIEIGRLPIPETIYKPAKTAVQNFLSDQLNGDGYSGLSVKSLEVKEGSLYFEGTLPKTITTYKY